MIEIPNPYRKDALIKSLETTQSELSNYFSSLSPDEFFKESPGKWSPSQNLVHLIKSVKVVTSGLRLPKVIIGLKFGKATRNSRLYPQIREVYLNKLAEGARSSKRLDPDEMKSATDFQSQKDEILIKWQDINSKLIRRLSSWKEETLDVYLLPHPILGRLTVRETIMFTIYHNIHHLTNVQKTLEAAN